MTTDIIEQPTVGNEHAVGGPTQETTTTAIRFTQLSAPPGKILTKHYFLTDDGKLEKKAIASFGSGTFSTEAVGTMAEFAARLNSMPPNAAHLYGICRERLSGRIVSEAFRNHKLPDQKSRTKTFFSFPDGPAIVACDIDAPKEGTPLTRDEVIAGITKVFPELTKTAVVFSHSASSYIFKRETSEQLRGSGGFRFYFALLNGEDIPRTFGVMLARLYLAGYGRFEVSAAGSLLERNMIDKAMAVPTQPDFCAGASCGAGLEQRRPPAELLWDGPPVDSTSVFKDLSATERAQLDAMREIDKARLAQAAAAQRAAWKAARRPEVVQSILQRAGKSLADPVAAVAATAEAELVLDAALESGELLGDFTLLFADGTQRSVRETLKSKDRFDQALVFDPHEPDYDGGRVVGKLYLLGKVPVLHSLAHGGRTFKLLRERASVCIRPGGQADAIEKTLEILRSDPLVFTIGSQFVCVEPSGLLHHFTQASLTQYLATEIHYSAGRQMNGRTQQVPVDPSPNIAKTILDLGEKSGIRQLVSVVTAPTMLPDGRLLTARGFDEETGLFLCPQGDGWPEIPEAPTREQLHAAFDVLWKPLELYPWTTPTDRGVALAGQLTALVRRVLRVAPGFAADAPTQSSGKTFYCQSIGILLSGQDEAVIPYAENESDIETKKTLIAAALAGGGTYILDNVTGRFESAALAAAMTAGYISGRVLGVSKMTGRLPFRMLLALSSNNAEFGADMAQRILVARIDHAVEKPHLKEYDLHPVAWTLAHRMEMVIAGLTLLRGFVAAGMPVTAPGRSRFDEWDRLIRQAVVWISHELSLDFGDPLDAVQTARENDTRREVHGELLQAWYREWGDQPMTISEIRRELDDMEAVYESLKKDKRPNAFSTAQWELLEAFKGLGNGNRLPSASTLGSLLRHRVGVIINGLRLERGPKRHGNKQTWRVREMSS